MVDLIASSGGEYVKHQTHSIEDKMTEKAKSIFPPNTKKSHKYISAEIQKI